MVATATFRGGCLNRPAGRAPPTPGRLSPTPAYDPGGNEFVHPRSSSAQADPASRGDGHGDPGVQFLRPGGAAVDSRRRQPPDGGAKGPRPKGVGVGRPGGITSARSRRPLRGGSSWGQAFRRLPPPATHERPFRPGGKRAPAALATARVRPCSPAGEAATSSPPPGEEPDHAGTKMAMGLQPTRALRPVP